VRWSYARSPCCTRVNKATSTFGRPLSACTYVHYIRGAAITAIMMRIYSITVKKVPESTDITIRWLTLPRSLRPAHPEILSQCTLLRKLFHIFPALLYPFSATEICWVHVDLDVPCVVCAAIPCTGFCTQHRQIANRRVMTPIGLLSARTKDVRLYGRVTNKHEDCPFAERCNCSLLCLC
jgi:hypothetical protein